MWGSTLFLARSSPKLAPGHTSSTGDLLRIEDWSRFLMGALVVCVCAFQVQGLEHELHVCSETGRGAANSNPALVSDGNPDLAGWTFAPRAMLDYYVLLATHVGPYRDFFFLIWDPCWGRTGEGAPIQCDGRWWSGASLRTGISTWYVALNAESEIPMRPGCFGSRRCRTQMPLEVRRSISRVVSSLYWIDLSKLPVL